MPPDGLPKTRNAPSLNPVWDNRFMSLLEQGRLSELDAIGNDELSAMAGKSTHEIKTWVAAFAAIRFWPLAQ